jgi:ribonuclease R
VITDVRMMGLMVEATDLGARGVIKREDLPRGDWRFEQSQMRWISRAGLQFQLGQRIQMQVARIDFQAKFVDFRIAGNALPEPVDPVGRSTPREVPSKKFRAEKPPKGKPERPRQKDKGKPRGKSPGTPPPKARREEPHPPAAPAPKPKRDEPGRPTPYSEKSDAPPSKWAAKEKPAGTRSKWSPREKPEGARSKWSPPEKPPGTRSKWAAANDSPAPPKKSPKRRRK